MPEIQPKQFSVLNILNLKVEISPIESSPGVDWVISLNLLRDAVRVATFAAESDRRTQVGRTGGVKQRRQQQQRHYWIQHWNERFGNRHLWEIFGVENYFSLFCLLRVSRVSDEKKNLEWSLGGYLNNWKMFRADIKNRKRWKRGREKQTEKGNTYWSMSERNGI